MKEKATAIRNEHTKSGINGTQRIPVLTNFENRVVAVMSMDALDGDGSSIERGRPEFRTVTNIF